MIEVKGLTKKFAQRVIFENVNCQLAEGKSYAIIGKSGTGKTTFLNILGGLETATAGTVMVDDQPVSTKNLPQLRRDKFGFIFQNFGLVDKETVAYNLKIGLANQRLSRQEQTIAMKEVLQQLGLANVDLKQRIFTLSGGEQQRLALARLLLKKPTIIFADEPTGSLDAANADEVTQHLLHDFGDQATIIVATHTAEVWRHCDYLIRVENCRITITENIVKGEKPA